MELELGGSVAVVTGAAKGMGRAAAIAFAPTRERTWPCLTWTSRARCGR